MNIIFIQWTCLLVKFYYNNCFDIDTVTTTDVDSTSIKTTPYTTYQTPPTTWAGTTKQAATTVSSMATSSKLVTTTTTNTPTRTQESPTTDINTLSYTLISTIDGKGELTKDGNPGSSVTESPRNTSGRLIWNRSNMGKGLCLNNVEVPLTNRNKVNQTLPDDTSVCACKVFAVQR